MTVDVSGQSPGAARAGLRSAGFTAGGVAVAASAGLMTYPLWRGWCLTWGAVGDEAIRTLPGDDLLERGVGLFAWCPGELRPDSSAEPDRHTRGAMALSGLLPLCDGTGQFGHGAQDAPGHQETCGAIGSGVRGTKHPRFGRRRGSWADPTIPRGPMAVSWLPAIAARRDRL